ncbi:hypothetical protein [Rossellomorea sp. KS-H15a]|uniref:hypothetical protein n=1 Tax=Rossellomorea sp. KS-H15a TaxID=2963940 RepID=UPI0020C60F80|nr:hypothetical protein [Rossellomorea sp. KS-H15a]UTE77981.1 hypothetical protein M1J35_04225 [Rossellomorea sp. KS-H15a]
MMFIVVDESLGLPKNLLTEVHIRPTTLKKGISLSYALEKGKKSWGFGKLPLTMTTTDEMLEEVYGWSMQDREVLYIYDEHTTPAAWVKRLQNWFYPNQHIYLVNGSVNRGLALHLLSNRPEIPSLLEGTRTEYVITSSSKYLDGRTYLKMGKKKPKKYYLIKNRVIESTASTVDELVEDIMRKHSSQNWIITSNGEFNQKELKGEYFQLEEDALPISSHNIYLYPLQQENIE